MNDINLILTGLDINNMSLLLINPKSHEDVLEISANYAKIVVFTKELEISQKLSSIKNIEVVFNNISMLNTYLVKQFDLSIVYNIFDFEDIYSSIRTLGFISTYTLLSFKNKCNLKNRIKFLFSGKSSIFQESGKHSKVNLVHIDEILSYLVKKSYMIDRIFFKTKNDKYYNYYNSFKFPNLLAKDFFVIYSDESSSNFLYNTKNL